MTAVFAVVCISHFLANIMVAEMMVMLLVVIVARWLFCC